MTIENFETRVENTDKEIKHIFNKSLELMLKKNKERGDNWRSVGVLGAFLELRSMYFRLRNQLWDEKRIQMNKNDKEWKKAVMNSLEDLRNFTMLMEMSLIENNFYGEKYDEK